ncbi:MAG TPA: GAF domain-containing protein [Thermomicrobiales bacterium]|nr:GAF domain-containing protein [Thermomicrobiales bacterium]
MDARHHADRQAVAGLLREHAESIHAAWYRVIVEQNPNAAQQSLLLPEFLDALFSYVADPDPAVPAGVAATWCQQVDPTTAGMVSTAVAMGLLGEALRQGLPDFESLAVQNAYGMVTVALPDFSAEFVRGLMSSGEMPTNEQHWYEVSQRLAAERTHRLKQLAILNDVSMALSSTLSLDEVYEIIYQQASRLVDTSNFYIATLGTAPGEMTRRLHIFGGARDSLDPDAPIRMGLTKEVVRESKLVIVDDYVVACRERGLPITSEIDQTKTLAWLGAPIVAGDRPIGVLVVMTENGPFDRDDAEILAAVARQAGGAMANARLFEAQRSQASQLRAINQISRAISTIREPDVLMQTSCTLIRDLFGYSVVSILLAHPDNDLLVLRTQSGLEGDGIVGYSMQIGGKGLIPHAAATCQPVLVNDVTRDARYVVTRYTGHIRSEVSIPLLRDGRLVGVLDLQSPHIDAFSEADVELLTTVGEQLTVALENAELLVQERKRRTELALILEVSQAANSSLVLDDVIQRVAEGISDAVGLPSCIVYLYDDEGDRLLPSAFVARDGSELDTSRISKVIPNTESSQLLRRIFLSGQEASAIEMLTCDVDDELAQVLSATAVLAVPFVAKQQFLGFALLVAHDAEYHFSPHQLRVAYGVAGAAALALENARLYARSHTLGMAEERIRVAREIHDGMAQGLTAVALNLEAADQLFEIKPVKSREKINRALELTRSNLEDARRSVLDLHASALQELTLTEALQRRTQQFLDEHREQQVTGVFNGESMYGRLSSRMELSLYRIFEEALDNVARHANATHIDVSIARGGDDVVLAVTDNGHGFDVEQALSARRTPGTFGLVAIRERVRLLHGTMEVHSADGQGTTMIVTVPYEAQHSGAKAPKSLATPASPVVLAGDGG